MIIKELEKRIRSKTRKALMAIDDAALIPRSLSCQIYKVMESTGSPVYQDVRDNDEVNEQERFLIAVKYQLSRHLGLGDDFGFKFIYETGHFELNPEVYMALYPMILIKVGESLLHGEIS